MKKRFHSFVIILFHYMNVLKVDHFNKVSIARTARRQTFKREGKIRDLFEDAETLNYETFSIKKEKMGSLRFIT